MVMPALPPPDWMGDVPRADSLAQLRADMPGVSLRATDPISVATEAFASALHNQRLFFNVSAVNALPQYSIGSALDGWAFVQGVDGEGLPPDVLRYQVFDAPNRHSAESRDETLVSLARKSSADVSGGHVVRDYTAGSASIYILATRDGSQAGAAIGTPPSALRDAAKAYIETNLPSFFSYLTPAPSVRSYSVGVSVEYRGDAVESEVREAIANAAMRSNDENRVLGGTVHQTRFTTAIYDAHSAIENVALTQFQITDIDGTNPVGATVGDLYPTQNRARITSSNPIDHSIAYSMREPIALTLAVSP